MDNWLLWISEVSALIFQLSSLVVVDQRSVCISTSSVENCSLWNSEVRVLLDQVWTTGCCGKVK